MYDATDVWRHNIVLSCKLTKHSRLGFSHKSNIKVETKFYPYSIF